MPLPSAPRPVILILADISGYTRFMAANRTELVHGQHIISELIKTIIRQVKIPLRVSKLEGDAVFLYAVKDGGEAVWERTLATIGEKLFGFFDAFADKVHELAESNVCDCQPCRDVEQLRLKLIVHAGEALFYRLDRFEELSGIDVIRVHRPLKNTVDAREYLLMTEAAYREIRFPRSIPVTESREIHEQLGEVKTFVFLPRELLQAPVGSNPAAASRPSSRKIDGPTSLGALSPAPVADYQSFYFKIKNEWWKVIRLLLPWSRRLKMEKT